MANLMVLIVFTESIQYQRTFTFALSIQFFSRWHCSPQVVHPIFFQTGSFRPAARHSPSHQRFSDLFSKICQYFQHKYFTQRLSLFVNKIKLGEQLGRMPFGFLLVANGKEKQFRKIKTSSLFFKRRMESELKQKHISKHPVVKHSNARKRDRFYAYNLRIDNSA